VLISVRLLGGHNAFYVRPIITRRVEGYQRARLVVDHFHGSEMLVSEQKGRLTVR